MQIFDLHFNPTFKEGQILDSFVYAPENIYEKRMGNLYIVGELQNALPQNLKFLDRLAGIIKKKYYSLSGKSPESALSETLKKTNEFLAEEVKRDNVSWLGNLNLAVFSLKDSDLILAKTGDFKILLIRSEQIIDIGKNFDLQEIEPYPLKVFFNVVSGKLTLNDVILILSKEIYSFFRQENILAKFSQAEEINAKKLKEILPFSLFEKGEGSKISGICFISLFKGIPDIQRKPQEFSFQKKGEKFSFWQFFSPLRNIFYQIKKFIFLKIKKVLKFSGISKKIKNFFSKITLLKILKEKALKPKILKKHFLKLRIIQLKGKKLIQNFPLRKNLTLLIFLSFFLILGFLIFKATEKKEKVPVKSSFQEIQKKINEAENHLIFNNQEKANFLLKEAWQEISNLNEKEPEILSLKFSIEEKLNALNKLEKIENPELAVDFNPNLFSAPELPLNPPPFEFNLDLSASYLSNLYFLDKKDCRIIKYSNTGWSIWSIAPSRKKPEENCLEPKSMAIDGSIWVLNSDNSIIRYYLGNYQETITLNLFPSPENITNIKIKANLPYLYFLEPVKNRVIITDKNGKILKQFQSEKFDKLKDFAISEDGKTIWLLNKKIVYQIKFNP